MTKTLKLLLIIGAATAIVVLLIIGNLDRPGGEKYLPISSNQSAKQTTPTGNVDNTVNELLEDVAGETALSAEEDTDADLMNDDSQAINAIGESYAGKEF